MQLYRRKMKIMIFGKISDDNDDNDVTVHPPCNHSTPPSPSRPSDLFTAQ